MITLIFCPAAVPKNSMFWTAFFSGTAPALINVWDNHYTKYKEKKDAERVSKVAPRSTNPINTCPCNTNKALSEIQRITANTSPGGTRVSSQALDVYEGIRRKSPPEHLIKCPAGGNSAEFPTGAPYQVPGI